jgi:predicted RNA-binding Zn-ribbon protein involved in translation (DUF1610 family)
MTGFGEYIPHRGPIMAYDLTCPKCGAHIDTRDAYDLEVLDEGVIGVMEWDCPECGENGGVSFFAEYADFNVKDNRLNRYYQMSREDAPSGSKNRKPAVKRAPAKRPAARKTPARKPATRRKTTGARR